MSTPRPGNAAFVVLAGGSGTRVGGGRNKVYLPLAGRPVISWSLAWAPLVAAVGPVLLVTRPGDEHLAAEAAHACGVRVEVVHGGRTRHASELAAFAALADRVHAGGIDVIAVHDAARPLAGAALLGRVIEVAAEHGGAVPTVPEPRAWRLGTTGLLPAAAPLHRVQTPQAFRARTLLAAYACAAEGTDTAAAMESDPDVRVVAVPGHEDNFKVTFPADLTRAEALLRAG